MLKLGETYVSNDGREFFFIVDVVNDMVKFKHRVKDNLYWRDERAGLNAFEMCILDGTISLQGEPIKLMKAGSEYCKHDFQSYTGIIETYEYCLLCDAKRTAV